MLKIHQITRPGIASLTLVAGLVAAALLPGLPGETPDLASSASYIVQGESLADVRSAVEAAGGEITHELGVIRAVGAGLDASQVRQLDSHVEQLKVFANRNIHTASVREGGVITDVARMVDADLLRSQGLNGSGVGIAFIDTGIESMDGIRPTKTRNVTSTEL